MCHSTVASSTWYHLTCYIAYRFSLPGDLDFKCAPPFDFFQHMSSIPSLMDIQAMPTRSFSVWNLREHTCPVCRAAYRKRNSLNRHSKAKHVPKLKCFFCEKMFPPDRNTRRSLHMLKTLNYPVPETYLQGPLNSRLDFNLMGNSIKYCQKMNMWPRSWPQSHLMVEENDCSGIPSVRLPSSDPPFRCSTPLMDEQPDPAPRLLNQKSGMPFILCPWRLQKPRQIL